MDALTEYSKVGRMISVLFETHGLSRKLTVRQNLEFYARVRGLPRCVRNDNIDKTLEIVGITDRQDSLAKTLSKGLLRRLALGRLFIMEPRILILDEPFDGIDVASRMAMTETLKNWVRQNEGCILLSSHNMQEIEELCNRLCVLKKGRLIGSGTLDSLHKIVGEDQIEVKLCERYEETLIRNALNEWGSLPAFTLAGKSLLLTIPGKEIGRVAGFLHQRGLRFEGMSIKRESLTEIYMRMVGHHE
jgi:ABC-2 type transport system ATP-binding protein